MVILMIVVMSYQATGNLFHEAAGVFFKILSLLNKDDDSLSCEVGPQMSSENLEGVQKAIWWAEWQANALAPRILMPRTMFLELFNQI